MKIVLLILACLFERNLAFVLRSNQPASQSQCLRSSHTAISATMRRRLSDIDLMALENVAEFCLSVDNMVEECDLEEHEALVNQLAEQRNILLEQRDILNDHVFYLDDVLGRLLGHDVAGHSLDENEIVYDQ